MNELYVISLTFAVEEKKMETSLSGNLFCSMSMKLGHGKTFMF